MRWLFRSRFLLLAFPAWLSAQQPSLVLRGPEPIRRQPYARYSTLDSLGRTITFSLEEYWPRVPNNCICY